MNSIVAFARGYQPMRFSAEHAALARCLARRRSIPDLGGFGVRTTAAPESIPDAVAFDLLEEEERYARLTVPRALLHHLLEAVDPAAIGVAPDVAALLLELHLESLLDRLEAECPSLTLRLRPARTAIQPAAFALGLALRYGTVEATVRLDLDAAAARSIAVALERLPDCPDGLPDLPMHLRVRSLAADVTLAELDAACPGDVILAEALPTGEVLLVTGERFTWRARHDGTQLQIVSPRLHAPAVGLERWVMSNEFAADDAAGLDELPVRLAFELGRIELPLAELALLGPGHVFELARNEAQPVDIVANGRRIGQGRIVDVAGSIGVQIVRMGRG